MEEVFYSEFMNVPMKEAGEQQRRRSRPSSSECLPESTSWNELIEYNKDGNNQVHHHPHPLLRRRHSYSEGISAIKTTTTTTVATILVPTATFTTNLTYSTTTSRRRPKKEKRHRNPYLIPSDHPYKIAWDVCTILLSLLSAYHTHLNIQKRQFSLHGITEIWFFIDILLNFLTEHKSSHGRTYKAVWARYLTTWFVVDALSLMPWETLYVQPLFDAQKRRGFFVKSFFRTRAVVRVTRLLRGRHFKLFGQVAKQTKHAGVGASRLLHLIIRYVPKYLMFYRNMKGVLVVRVLRQVHWIRKLIKNVTTKKFKMATDDATSSLTEQDDSPYDGMEGDDLDDLDDDDDQVEVYFDEGYETDL